MRAAAWLLPPCLLLQACGSAPPAPAAAPATAPAPVPAVASPSEPAGIARFERHQREGAEAATRQGRLAEAGFAWEVLVALRPQRSDYRERLAEVRAQAQALAAERLPKAAAARRRGELDNAAQLYLGVLALDPSNDTASDALRAIERERNKRNHLGRFARDTLTRRPAGDAVKPAPNGRAAAEAPGSRPAAERNTLEHASMLASQGELDEAIALLQAPTAGARGDSNARRLLAALLVQKADRLAPADRATAIATLERSLQLDPAQAAAKQRLQALREGIVSATGASAPARKTIPKPPAASSAL